MNPDVVLHVGRLGTPGARVLGAVAIYVALNEPILLRVGNNREWRSHEYSIVPPYVRHQIATLDSSMATVLIEPEIVDWDRLPYFDEPTRGARAFSQLGLRVRELHAKFQRSESMPEIIGPNLDVALFDTHLEVRQIDRRIAGIIDEVRARPSEELSAQDCADAVKLSFSRFLHLFKAETGIAFRRFKAWKRARNSLQFINDVASLADIAIRAGYPDSTYFSHSIRTAFGLKPKEMFAVPGLSLYTWRGALTPSRR